MKWLLYLLLIAIPVSICISFSKKNNASQIVKTKVSTEADELLRLKSKTAFIKKYLKQNNFNTSYCFIADMTIASGSYRFFVFDIENDSIMKRGLVTHGSGRQYSDTIQYSNEPGSLCTSPGMYRIGACYYGRFGLAYKLFGLQKSNSNAIKRAVVLHAHPAVPLTEIAPAHICKSWGCPTVSPIFLQELKPLIDESKKPLLLWIIN